MDTRTQYIIDARNNRMDMEVRKVREERKAMEMRIETRKRLNSMNVREGAQVISKLNILRDMLANRVVAQRYVDIQDSYPMKGMGSVGKGIIPNTTRRFK